VVATAARYVQKAGSAGELAEVSYDLRLSLSVQVVVGAPGSKQCIHLFLKNMLFRSIKSIFTPKKSNQALPMSEK
jgi:hypothetical protein